MKGQLSYIIKPISLVMTIILLLLLYYSISNFGTSSQTVQKDLDINSDATSILLVLANSEDCLAFHSPVTEGVYANIVDVDKLNEFTQKYSDTEPECARSFDFGWRATITEFRRVEGTVVEGNTWSFGAKDFSKDKAFRDDTILPLPIAIRYSDKLTRSGVLRIHVVDGELEKISGILDWTCQLFKTNRLTQLSAEIRTSYPLSYNQTTDELCSMSKDPSCRIMWCPLNFPEIKSAGNYILKITYSGGMMVVKT